MRFHCGISFKPKFNKIKWIVLGLLGLGSLFFSNILVVNASSNITPSQSSILWGATKVSTNEGERGIWGYTIGQHVQMGVSGAAYRYGRSGALLWFQQNSGTYSAQIEYYFNWIVHDITGCVMYASDITNNQCNISDVKYDYNNLTTKIIVDFYWSTATGYTEFYLDMKGSSNVVYPNTTYIGYSLKSFVFNPDGTSIIIGQNNTIINQNDTIINQNDNIINNQTEINDSINDINDTLTEEYDGSAGGHEFDLPNYNYPSTIQGFFNLPIDLLRTIVNNSDTCTPYEINLSSITQRWGGFNYTLTLPCLRAKLQSLLGVIYSVVDSLIAFYLFYNMAMYVLQIIDAITSGTDLFSYLYHSSNNNYNTGYGHYNRDTGEVVD